VAEYLGLSERQVLRMVHDGRIPATKFGHNWFFSPRRVAGLVGMDR
jgi:excisionase family DNA binding protein